MSTGGPGPTARYLVAAALLVGAAGAVSWLARSTPSSATAPPPPPSSAPAPAPPSPTTATPPTPAPTAPPTVVPPPSGSVSASLDVDGLELFREHPFDEVVYRLDLAVGAPPASVTVAWDPRLAEQLVAVGGSGCTTNPCTMVVTGSGARVVASVRPTAGLDPHSVTATVTVAGTDAPPVTVTAAELPDRTPPPVAEPPGWPALVAWCGIEPEDPLLAPKAEALVAAGVGAMHGPCRRPDWATYTASRPGRRYMAPDEYLRLVQEAERFGLRVIVYDERVWSADPAARAAAVAQWRPAAQSGALLAFDASDEINRDEWPVLVERHDLYTRFVQPELGVPLFASHLPWMDQLAARDVPAMVPLSVNTFWDDDTAAVVARHPGRPLHCTLNLAAFGPFTATPDSVAAAVGAPWAGACRSWLLFNPTADANPDLFANVVSTWDAGGRATPLLDAVRQAFAAG